MVPQWLVSLYVATMHASLPITYTSSFLSLPEPCSPPSPHISLLCWPPQAPFLLNDHQFCYVDLVMLGKYSTIELYLQHFMYFFLNFETQSHLVSQDDLQLAIFQPQPSCASIEKERTKPDPYPQLCGIA